MLSFSFLWEIENVRSLFHEDITGHPSIYSSEFSVIDNDQYAFKLRMHPKGDTETNSNHISLYLHLSSKSLTKAMVLYRFSIIDAKSQKFNSKALRNEIGHASCYGHEKFISRETILNSANGLLRNGKLTILCEGEVVPEADALSETDLSSRFDKFCNTSYVHSNKGCFSAMRSIQFSNKWNIGNYRNQSQVKDFSYLESSLFSVPNEGEYKFKLQLHPKGDSDENKDCFSLYIYNESNYSKPLLILCKFSIIDNNGLKCKTKCFKSFFSQNDCWGMGQYFKHDKIYRQNLIQNDTLTVVCEGEIVLNGDSLTELDLQNHLGIFKEKQIFKCVPISKSSDGFIGKFSDIRL